MAVVERTTSFPMFYRVLFFLSLSLSLFLSFSLSLFLSPFHRVLLGERFSLDFTLVCLILPLLTGFYFSLSLSLSPLLNGLYPRPESNWKKYDLLIFGALTFQALDDGTVPRTFLFLPFFLFVSFALFFFAEFCFFLIRSVCWKTNQSFR